MKLSDRILFALSWRLCNSNAGISAYRAIRWLMPYVLPYRPKPAVLSPESLATGVPVDVGPSSIAGAGQGLFALARLEAGQDLGEYCGDRVESIARWLRLPCKDYVMQTDQPTVFIDASLRPEALMRYVNHNFDPGEVNVVRQVRAGKVYYVALRSIEAGEEFFVDYGDLYWQLRGVNRPEARMVFQPTLR